jgi:hypothetical protein
MPGRPSACRLPGWGASNHRPRAPVRRGPQETPLVGCRDRRASCELDPWWTPLLRALTGECLPLAQRATGSPWGLIIGQCSDSGHRIRPLGIGAATSGMLHPQEFDVIVVGGGHAGTEAALAAARMGCATCC